MTPAIKQLEDLSFSYQLHQYQHDSNCQSYGEEAIAKLQVNAAQVFKTLVVQVDNHELAVAIIPVLSTLNLKKMAKSLNAKKVLMAEAKVVQKSTGYVLGGVSPFGQKKPLTTLLDDSAENLTTLFVSGGKRGLEIETSPQSLIQTLNATYASIGNKVTVS
ncbi:Cys-tRNA(Pro)/Cys-tRNA(Cys) deacylase [Colwellia chukchiensis]|uniref:Cys-tRNA(Pro)/Cys-tRNA(Cys) deacylase n=1 Tax=Colwellia chukchiensis TaxID=641665 RepID=A0A1H7SLN9_9GAMM|nr:Cys-tRNA(Pro) deacylase [Colwellia chukchiensis]SEL73378.1 Cys-tRNA(Pro)/Cys-tRNA(Cys) deacylase [Colwellia chukchiensis]